MNSQPVGIYLEKERRFEFDFFKHLLKITFPRENGHRTIVSPFRMIKNDDDLFLLIHNYDRSGERRIKIESMDLDELIINDDNTSYKLNKVA